ncbi:hypothetical protein BAE44_0022810 [Dichanthelium oligosanthes]|uniref:tRNA A64-2'-O-ribosylphosphate transferase n=1 Tax=Dichanthelium oligosanthes TaxID=888268 RepID=A0A1E5UTI7_9POAL|nr:hypothetical protein BAE44_0022810 [Dichanthelium oligosanthes]
MAAPAPEPAAEPSATLSIYKAARRIKRRASTLYNALRSVAEDAAFVAEVAALWPALPLVANLRCGLWYAPPRAFAATCYFKSTDGHAGNWSFSTARLNLHLALLTGTEKNAIEGRIEEWTDQFESCGADIHSLAINLQKPLRPLWISQRTRIWLNEVPDLDSWDFTPIILINASASDAVATQRMSSEFSWQYIPGAGDDEESWARGLTPTLFWKHSYDLLDAGPDHCNQLVADIVEKDRVYRAQRGEHSPQISSKPLKSHDSPKCNDDCSSTLWPMNSDPCTSTTDARCSNNGPLFFWIGTSNLAVSSTLQVADALVGVDCILNCDSTSKLPSNSSENSYLELSIVDDRFSLMKNLSKAVDFAKRSLIAGRKILVCCQNGEDISICVTLAIVTLLFDDNGCFDYGNSFAKRDITKLEMRRRLVFICKFAVNARPSRGNLKQVYGFLSSEKERLSCLT